MEIVVQRKFSRWSKVKAGLKQLEAGLEAGSPPSAILIEKMVAIKNLEDGRRRDWAQSIGALNLKNDRRSHWVQSIRILSLEEGSWLIQLEEGIWLQISLSDLFLHWL